jgi:hypothetical protein
VTVTATALLSALGGALVSDDTYRLFSSGLLLVMGLYYLRSYIAGARDSCCAEPASSHSTSNASTSLVSTELKAPILSSTSNPHVTLQKAPVMSFAEDMTTAASLIAMTTLTPCVGSMPVLFSLVAPPASATRVLAAALVLLATSALTMTFLVAAAHAGASRFHLSQVRRHERLVLGVGLIILAVFTFAVLTRHDGHAHHHHHHHVAHVHRSDGSATPGQTLSAGNAPSASSAASLKRSAHHQHSDHSHNHNIEPDAL